MVRKVLYCLNRLDERGGRPWLLHALASNIEKGKAPQRSAPEEETAHSDERQIRLDTERSFVLYPVGENFPFLAYFFGMIYNRL